MFIKVFRTVSPPGDAQPWATSQLDMSLEQLQKFTQQAWRIETYHRAIKQTLGIEFEVENPECRFAKKCLRIFNLEKLRYV
jgi:hypothetical protein